MTSAAALKGFEVTAIGAVAAIPEDGQLVILFNTKEDGNLTASLPVELVGSMIAAIAAEHQQLAMKQDDTAAVLMPMGLTGARSYDAGENGDPVLLLQLDRVFELALRATPEILEQLEGAVESLRSHQGPSGHHFSSDLPETSH